MISNSKMVRLRGHIMSISVLVTRRVILQSWTLGKFEYCRRHEWSLPSRGMPNLFKNTIHIVAFLSFVVSLSFGTAIPFLVILISVSGLHTHRIEVLGGRMDHNGKHRSIALVVVVVWKNYLMYIVHRRQTFYIYK